MRQIDIGGGTKLNVVDRGAGPAVLFIHGFPLDHRMWNAQLDALSANNRLIAPDLRGFGRSSVTEGTVTMEQFADDLTVLLDRLSVRQPVCLCGLSMGGYVAFQFLRKYPAHVRSLVLCDTRSAADTPEGAQGRRQMAEKVVIDGAASVANGLLPKLLHPRTPSDRPAVAQAVREMILATDPCGIAAAQRGMAARPDVTAELPSIKVRTLVLVGQEDAISPPAEMQTLAEAIPGARFVVVPEAGHMAPMENPAAFNYALAGFLANELHAR